MNNTQTPEIFDPSPDDAPWFLLRIKPNSIQRAEDNLERQNVATFMPRQSVFSNKGIVTLKPLFPGYLFASFEPQDTPFRTVNSTYGVSCLVTSGYNLTTGLPLSLIIGLKNRCDGDGVLCPPADLRPDETIRVLTGPFADFIASVEKLSDHKRVQIMFELMGQTVHAELPISQVERMAV